MGVLEWCLQVIVVVGCVDDQSNVVVGFSLLDVLMINQFCC
jgi:hypothetical protein